MIWTEWRRYRMPELGGMWWEGGATSAADLPRSAMFFVGRRSQTVTLQSHQQTEVKGDGTGVGGGGGSGDSRKKEKNWF
ncbi:hypothetical protein V6N11_049994 [Hibiscus sabdariffa]|uniref:Uncharacterized protein n=1 Tax=Hibiscus sabdariffa TaxID=183260 RepID=A0ABR2T8J7_9ROSI